ncbi:hypothetical protein SteCoe_2459 [Stentor coeruleus]|uniref:HPt domain-containing protein n=1 Tax=Stentor coeruleus TaxID=5963 RepID=A0A1R2CZH4_9CILI|nr:hypothetical protein SteCoe_2459 [Stentor coeruleus]
MSEKLESLIDFEMGKVYLGRDHDTFLKRFVEIDLQVYINKLQTLNARSDFEELVRSSDSLHSTSAYVGAKRCQEISKQINEWAKKNDLAKVQKEISELVDHAENLENLLKNYFSSDSAAPTGEGYDAATTNIEESGYESLSFRLKPPIKEPVVDLISDREDEFDPYAEINKDWKCIVS